MPNVYAQVSSGMLRSGGAPPSSALISAPRNFNAVRARSSSGAFSSTTVRKSACRPSLLELTIIHAPAGSHAVESSPAGWPPLVAAMRAGTTPFPVSLNWEKSKTTAGVSPSP